MIESGVNPEALAVGGNSRLRVQGIKCEQAVIQELRRENGRMQDTK
jgi:hypothetical protein